MCPGRGVINEKTLPELQCSIIAGAANNILEQDRYGPILAQKGILYAPDYVLNAGALISVADQLEGFDQERVRRRVLAIYDNCLQVFSLADKEDLSPVEAADRIAEKRLSREL